MVFVCLTSGKFGHVYMLRGAEAVEEEKRMATNDGLRALRRQRAKEHRAWAQSFTLARKKEVEKEA